MGMVLMIVLMNYQRATVRNQMHVMGGSGGKLIPTLLGAKRLVISAIDVEDVHLLCVELLKLFYPLGKPSKK